MQFLVKIFDYKDALERRIQARQEHLEKLKQNMQKCIVLNAGVIMQDEKMSGSALFVELKNKEELLKFLHADPYVEAKVWDFSTLEIHEVKLAK